MGKATVTSNLGHGNYWIEIKRKRDQIDAEIADLEALLEDIDPKVADAQEALDAAQDVVDDARAIVEEAILWYQDEALSEGKDIAHYQGQIDKLMVQLAEVAADRDKARLEYDQLRLRQVEAQDRLDTLNAIPGDPIQQAWSADYVESLSGDVATAEIPGEGIARTIILPGYNGNTWSAAAGQMAQRAGMTGPQAYFNAAILPGWQRWKPYYRVGSLVAVDKDADTGSVQLDPEDSSAQTLPINPLFGQPDYVGVLTDVPIEYMDCNAEVFETGDRVLVRFENQSWATPKVIGFESNPKPCAEDPGWPGAVSFETITMTNASETQRIMAQGPNYREYLGPDSASCWLEGDELGPTGSYEFWFQDVEESKDWAVERVAYAVVESWWYDNGYNAVYDISAVPTLQNVLASTGVDGQPPVDGKYGLELWRGVQTLYWNAAPRKYRVFDSAELYDIDRQFPSGGSFTTWIRKRIYTREHAATEFPILGPGTGSPQCDDLLEEVISTKAEFSSDEYILGPTPDSFSESAAIIRQALIANGAPETIEVRNRITGEVRTADLSMFFFGGWRAQYAINS